MSSTDDLLNQVTCGSIGIEKAVVIPKSYYAEISSRLKSFSSSKRYKTKFLSEWRARDLVYTFLATRCSKEFLDLFLKDNSEVLMSICKPGLYLDWSAEVRLAKKLFELNLLPEE